MIIKKLSIGAFGKLENKEVNLNEGFNIIYGENEAGKSTIQTYMKSMLFGIVAKRTKDLKTNERMKYLPLKGGKAYGEMLIYHGNNNIIIKKAFGMSKKEDENMLIDEITGAEIKSISKEEPGKDILGVNNQSFENTLFIRQLGALVQTNKDDEVMHRITNTFQSGQDGVSYQKAQNNLETLKKQLTTSRKGGKLDMLRLRQHNLSEERYEALNTAEENIHNELRIIDLKEHREFLNKEIKKAEISKKYLKKIKLNQEYKEITEYLKKSQDLKNKRQEVEGSLRTKEGIIDLEFIHSIKEEARLYFNLKDILDERQEKLKALNNIIDEKKEKLNIYKGYEELPKDIEKNIMTLTLENKALEEKCRMSKIIYEDIALIEKKINKVKCHIPNYNKMEQHYSQIEKDFQQYEDGLKTLKFKVENQQEEYKHETNNLLKIIRIAANVVMGINSLFIIFIFAMMLSGNITPLKGTYLSVPALIPLSFLFIFKNKIMLKKKKMEVGKIQGDEIENLKLQITNMEKKFDYYLKDIGLKSYEELGYIFQNFNKKQKEIEILSMRIEEKKNNISLLNEEVPEKVLEENNKILDKLINFAKVEDVEELIENVKLYRGLKEEINLLTIESDGVYSNLEHVKEDMESKEALIKSKLQEINLSHIEIYEIFDELEKLISKLKQREEIEATLRATEEGYKALLKERDLEAMGEELEEFINETEEFSYGSEEELEREVKEKQRDLINIEKEIKDVENAIKNVYLGKRSLVKIEEDIENIKEEIWTQEKKLKALELAIDFLEQSFKEIQKSFGPVLNQKVAEVFSLLTSGNYQEVKVTENYDLKVRNSNGNDLISVNYLSNGSADQVYLSLRIALINLIFRDEKVPIILDEAFVQYDDKRLEKALDLLLEISKHKQVILLTCQKREVEYLKNKKEINIINL